MLIIDVHEAANLVAALKQLVPDSDTMSTSQFNWPDFYWTAPDGTHGHEHKAWGEVLGSLDHIEEQLGRQHPTVDHHGIIIRGVMTPWQDGKSCMTWDVTGKGWMKATGRGWDRATQKPIPYQQNYKGLMQKLAAFQEWGIEVHQVHGWQDTANLVAGLYYRSQNPEEHSTFRRMIKEKREVDWGIKDEGVRELTRQLMTWTGEEVAVAIASSSLFPRRKLAEVIKTLESTSDEANGEYMVSQLPLRSGKRKVGPAAVRKLMEGLGL